MAGDGEYAGADDGAEAEPDEVPPRQATLHLVLALLAELDELAIVGGAVEEAVPQPRAGLRHGGSVRRRARERRLREEVLLAPSPVASRLPLLVVSLVLVFLRWLRPYIHGGYE